MSGSLTTAALERWLALGEIRQRLFEHSRAIDRCDAERLKSVYHPDGDVAYGFFDGNAHEFAVALTEGTRALPVTMHRTQNAWVHMTSATTAASESYVVAYMHVPGEGTGTQSLIGGRYLDRHERRGGTWKMMHRTYVLDWNVNQPGTGSAAPDFTPLFVPGAKHPADPAAAFLTPPGTSANPEGVSSMQLEGDLAARVDAAIAREDIHALICAQARGSDRADTALLKSLWHGGATVDIGPFPNDALEYVDAMLGATASVEKMFHSVNNEWIDVRGDTAVAETYVIAFTTTPNGDAKTDDFTGGRYLDRFERRDGVWKFTHRTFVIDWHISQPTTDQSGEGLFAQLTTVGRRSKDDPVYAHWPA